MLNDALRLIRIYHDMAQSELADQLGISKSYLSELENNHKNVTLDILDRYSKFFEIPMSSLMLFAERSDANGAAEGTRMFVASKVVKMLDWLASIELGKKTKSRTVS